jgi:hypothetical protein
MAYKYIAQEWAKPEKSFVDESCAIASFNGAKNPP